MLSNNEELDKKRLTPRGFGFLRMNPPSFIGSSTTEDPENLVEDLKKDFDVICIVDAERVELDAYYLNNNFIARPAQSQESVTHRHSSAPTCANCCRTHPGKCRDGHTYYFNCGQEGHFIRVGPKNMQGSGNLANRAQSSLVAQPNKAAPRGATSGIDGGVNHLYAITSRHDQENSLDVFTSMIKVITFDVYALLDVGSILSFVTP
ncbi:uncharacterized protein LOC107006335 [Solanum pennellii]|uniref:Uncharacterized protein LOC107006335 n=1 Tax=Solanum pennellii TaxID=28526 RepID=A0ABM1FQV5_SOLPN|nr:uncharacterized protein LOC107006335 [Solanum pennellii]